MFTFVISFVQIHHQTLKKQLIFFSLVLSMISNHPTDLIFFEPEPFRFRIFGFDISHKLQLFLWQLLFDRSIIIIIMTFLHNRYLVSLGLLLLSNAFFLFLFGWFWIYDLIVIFLYLRLLLRLDFLLILELIIRLLNWYVLMG